MQYSIGLRVECWSNKGCCCMPEHSTDHPAHIIVLKNLALIDSQATTQSSSAECPSGDRNFHFLLRHFWCHTENRRSIDQGLNSDPLRSSVSKIPPTGGNSKSVSTETNNWPDKKIFCKKMSTYAFVLD